MGPRALPPVCRVRTLGTFKGEENELSFQLGSIIPVHRLSETRPEWIVGTLDKEKGYVPANTVACYGSLGGLKSKDLRDSPQPSERGIGIK